MKEERRTTERKRKDNNSPLLGVSKYLVRRMKIRVPFQKDVAKERQWALTQTTFPPPQKREGSKVMGSKPACGHVNLLKQ